MIANDQRSINQVEDMNTQKNLYLKLMEQNFNTDSMINLLKSDINRILFQKINEHEPEYKMN